MGLPAYLGPAEAGSTGRGRADMDFTRPKLGTMKSAAGMSRGGAPRWAGAGGTPLQLPVALLQAATRPCEVAT